MNSSSLKYAYLAIAFLLCVIPSVGLLLGGAEESSDTDAAPAPELVSADGSFNVNVMSDAGKWFEDHFAWRNEWVTASSMVTGRALATSSSDTVIEGTDGWLYYGTSLADYQATNALTDRQLFDVAHSLARMQEYAADHGADFVFAVAPNKNSLYDEHMPYYYKGFVTGKRNFERLLPVLDSQGVNYVNLHDLFGAQEEVLYHKRDSHWNNKGAQMAAAELLDALEHEHPDYAGRAYSVRSDFVGDLDKMLYPSLPTAEDEVYFDPEPAFEYSEPVESNFDSRISTTADAHGNLLMYRDSFGNALLPFMAESFGTAFFTRGVPYQFSADLLRTQADTVVVERAERFLPQMASEPPALPSSLAPDGVLAGAGFTAVEDAQAEEAGESYTIVSGKVGMELPSSDALLYVRVNGVLEYEALGYSDADGAECFQIMVPTEVLQEENTYELCVK